MLAQSPAFGQADLTNCERELIHLAGSIQPHGVLLVLSEPTLAVVQASANVHTLLGVAVDGLLGRPLSGVAADLAARIERLRGAADLAEPVPFLCLLEAGGQSLDAEGTVHRHPGGGLIVELQPLEIAGYRIDTASVIGQVSAAVQRFAAAANIATLADTVARAFRDLTGHDRVMVYKFDPDGHGKIIAEARDPRLESLLGHHYPASDIPQRARELYIRNRVRVLVDAHYEPVPLQPRLLPLTDGELDMSLCHLRSMSPLHIQYLKNMGVTATLVVSLVREGRLWGLVAAHHYAPRPLPYALKTASELMGEVISTRIAAIENYAHAQVAILVRRLEQRLIEATSSEGDWRLALFRNPQTLLQPLEATGAALFHDGDVLTSGEVPSTPELRALVRWIDQRHASPAAGSHDNTPFSCSSVGRENPALESLTPVASGVLAVRLSTARPDYLMWFRKEQLTSVTWAGNPSKVVVGNDPLELSPRRSFAAWSEIVRGTALAWTPTEIVLARAVGVALVDIIVQVHAVRLLIAEHHLEQTRATVRHANEAVLIADAEGRVLFSNPAFAALVGPAVQRLRHLDDLAALFVSSEIMACRLRDLRSLGVAWRGEPSLAGGAAGDRPVPVALRAEPVQGPEGAVLGYMLLFADRRETRRAVEARAHLERSLSIAANTLAAPGEGAGLARRADVAPQPDLATRVDAPGTDPLVRAILTHASLAAMDIAEAAGGPPAAPLIEELEAATQRATRLYGQIRSLLGPR